MCRFLSFLLLVELYPLEFHPGPRLRSAEAGERLGTGQKLSLLTEIFIGNRFVPFFLILCLRSRDNLEPWPIMAFLLPREEIVYYHYQLQQD